MGFRNVYMVETLDDLLEDTFAVCVCETKEDAEHFIRERGYVKASDNSRSYVLDMEKAHRCSRDLVFCEFEDCPLYIEWADRVCGDIQEVLNTEPCPDIRQMCVSEDESTRYYIREIEMYERD